MTAPNVMAYLPPVQPGAQYRLGNSLIEASTDIWLNGTNVNGVRTSFAEPEGWEGLEFITPVDTAGGRDGGLIGPPSVAPRILDVEGAAVAPSPAALRRWIAALRAKLGPRKQVVWDQLDPETGIRYGMVCYAQGDFTPHVVPGNGGVAATISFTLMAANPPWKLSTGAAQELCTGLPAEQDVGGRSYGGVDANTVTNPSFEVDTAGWFSFGGTLGRSTDQAHGDGTASGLVTPDGTTGTGVYGLSSTDAPAVTPGNDYRWTLWVYSPGGWDGVRPVIRWLDSGGAEVAQIEGTDTVLAAGVWTQIQLDGTAPTGATNASGRVWQRNTPSGTDTIYLDDARLSEVNGKTYDWDYGGSEPQGGFIYATNQGGITAWPVFTITGPVDTPTISNVTTDLSFVINANIPAGSSVVIDARTGLVDPSTYRLVGRPWGLAEGRNTIRWRDSAGTFHPDAELCVSWRHTNQ